MHLDTHHDKRSVRFGAAALVLSTVQFYAAHLVVESAWPRPYSWLLYNLSDLGNVTCGVWNGSDNPRYVCSPLHALMNGSFMAHGVLVMLGLGLTWPLWRRAVATAASRLLLALAGTGFFLAGLYPADVNENPHVLGAFLIFFLGNLGLMLTERPQNLKGARGFRFVSCALGAIGMAASILFLDHRYLGLGMGGMERLAVLPLQLWFLWAGVLIWRGR